MFSAEEFLEIVEALEKPLEVEELTSKSVTEILAANKAEAIRAAEALVEYYKYKQQQLAK